MTVHQLPSKEREKILDLHAKAGGKDFETEYGEKGQIVRLKKKTAIKKGKKSKAKGGAFELRVRKDLEEKGWIVDKWSNNVDLTHKDDKAALLGKIVPAKRKYNPFSKALTIGTGFPDFIALQKMGLGRYKVIGVEVKINGKLSREEKLKAKWYQENEVFAEFKVAKKTKENNRIRIEYIDIKDILARMR